MFELLTENGLNDFYRLSSGENMSLNRPASGKDFGFLDDPETRRRLVDFDDGRTTRVTFHLEAIHCIACVWLLENLPRLHPGVVEARVHFSRRDLAVRFDARRLKLSEVAALLTSLGYEPELNLGRLDRATPSPQRRRLHLQLGVAGFAFGNTMLFSIGRYLGLENGPLGGLVGWLSLGLTVPVMCFSAADYWRSAWLGLRQCRLVIEVPVVLGLAALFSRGAWEIATGAGEGYFDSLAGFVFFLLVGRIFQQKTYDRLSFERDYRAFFPLSVRQREGDGERDLPLAQVQVGDRLCIRHGELIPADAELTRGIALVDYSFVSGEADPVRKCAGEHLYAGGRQCGGAIEVTTVKPVSQSYLASLWNADTFSSTRREARESGFDSLTNRFSPWFTTAVVGIAMIAALAWAAVDAGRAVTAFTSVLIVACPCALALAAPFGLGTAQRLLGLRSIFLKRPAVLEKLARVDTVVFDKTGTLTSAVGACGFTGAELSESERNRLGALLGQSTHPHARSARAWCGKGRGRIEGYREAPARGLTARVDGVAMTAGNAAWLSEAGIAIPEGETDGPVVHIAIDGRWRGRFEFSSAPRPSIQELANRLSDRLELALLSGDHPGEADRFGRLLGQRAELRFQQSPADKLAFIRQLQERGHTVMMVGDGLNDAGALQQADVGVAVVEDTARFCPASDIILEGGRVGDLDRLLDFAARSVRVVRICLGVSVAYNLAGLWFAAGGLLSPVVCAVLMPLSSITVVTLASGLTALVARRLTAPMKPVPTPAPLPLALNPEVAA